MQPCVSGRRLLPLNTCDMISTMQSAEQKRSLGQYFTQGNPFHLKPFGDWMERFWENRPILLEPFAGANNIIRLVRAAGWDGKWWCCDIQPPAPQAEGVEVVRRDSLANFPSGFRVAITNPPYLAKNSAVRRGLAFPSTPYDDLYKVALERMLGEVDYVAAIIPESFLTADLFHRRLVAGISLTSKMFEDTDHPVCLALFVPAEEKKGTLFEETDFEIWDGNRFLGMHKDLTAGLGRAEARQPWKFNDPQGLIGLRALDGTSGASIQFVRGETIPSEGIKHSSRALSRIGGCPVGYEDAIIAIANRLIDGYRASTHDALMTAFKGLRKDGRYRRRLDFAQARRILDLAFEELLAAT